MQRLQHLLTLVEEKDILYSSHLHKWSLSYLDYLLVIPGLLCSSHCVPGLIVLIYLMAGVPLGLFTTIASLLTVAVTETIKKSTQRERPEHEIVRHRLLNLRSLLTNYSFPSGDSAQSAALSISLYNYCRSVGLDSIAVYWLLLIPIVMFARVYFGCHWIGDVFMGAAFGAAITITLWIVWVDIIQLPLQWKVS